MAQYNENCVDGVLLKLNRRELTDENKEPAFYFNRPRLSALYANSSTGEIKNALSLKYFRMPKLTSYPMDLNEGFDKYIFRRHDLSRSLDKVLKFILEAEENILQAYISQEVQVSNFISPSVAKVCNSSVPAKRTLILTQRKLLTRLMKIPYNLYKPDKYNDILFHATRYCGVMHFADTHTYESHQKIASYHGKFNQHCFSDDPNLDPITDVPVDDNDVTFSIYRSNMKQFDFIYSAEVSGVIADCKVNDIHNLDELNRCKFIVSKLMLKSENENILKHPKCLLWWLQLYMANTNDIFIGLRDTAGIVGSPAQHFRVQDIPKDQYWKPKICIRFLNTILNLIEKTMSQVNCPYTVYEFNYDSNIQCIKFKVHRGKTKLSFLSEEYIEHCKKQTNSK